MLSQVPFCKHFLLAFSENREKCKYYQKGDWEFSKDSRLCPGVKYFLATADMSAWEKNSEDCIFTIHMFPQNYVQNVNKNDLKRARRVPQGSLMNQKVFYIKNLPTINNDSNEI